jgi:hypothetical protein
MDPATILLVLKDVGLPLFTKFFLANNRLPTDAEIEIEFKANADKYIKQGEDFLNRTDPNRIGGK